MFVLLFDFCFIIILNYYLFYSLFFHAPQYCRPSQTRNCYVEILKRGSPQLWDIALIKSFYWLNFNEKEYVFVVIQIFPKVLRNSSIDRNTGFKMVMQDPLDEIVIISASIIKQKVVFLKFDEYLPGFNHRKVTFVLADYK